MEVKLPRESPQQGSKVRGGKTGSQLRSQKKMGVGEIRQSNATEPNEETVAESKVEKREHFRHPSLSQPSGIPDHQEHSFSNQQNKNQNQGYKG